MQKLQMFSSLALRIEQHCANGIQRFGSWIALGTAAKLETRKALACLVPVLHVIVKNAAFKQAEVELHDHLGHGDPNQEDHHRVTVVDQAQDLLALLRLGTTITAAGCLMLIALLMMLHKRATCNK